MRMWYSFLCDSCGEFDLRLRTDQDNLQQQKCPKCGKASFRKYRIGGIQFIGSGFHINDYRETNEAKS